jgi:hypothetical protein
VEAWRESLTAEQVGVIERVARRPLAAYGYPPSGAGARPGVPALLSCRGWIVRTGVTLARDHAQDRWTRLREPNPVAAVGNR